MDARCPGWGRGPSMMSREARGSGTVGRKPRVRPVLEPVVARRSVGAMGERSKSRPGAKGRGEAVLVVVLEDEVAEVLGEDTLWEARNGARDETSRGGYTRSVKRGWLYTRSVKGGWLATRIVTRGAFTEIR